MRNQTDTTLYNLTELNQLALFKENFEWYCDGAHVQHCQFTKGVLIVNTKDKKFSFSSDGKPKDCYRLPVIESVENKLVMEANLNGTKITIKRGATGDFYINAITTEGADLYEAWWGGSDKTMLDALNEAASVTLGKTDDLAI